MNEPIRELVGVVDSRIQWDRPAILFGALLVQRFARTFVSGSYEILAGEPGRSWSFLFADLGYAWSWASHLWVSASIAILAALLFRRIQSPWLAIAALALGYVFLVLPGAYLILVSRLASQGILEDFSATSSFFWQYWGLPSMIVALSYLLLLFGCIEVALRKFQNRRRAVLVGAVSAGLLYGVVGSVASFPPGPELSELLRNAFRFAAADAFFALFLTLGFAAHGLPAAAGPAPADGEPTDDPHAHMRRRMDKFVNGYWVWFFGSFALGISYVAATSPELLGIVLGIALIQIVIAGLILRWMLNRLKRFSNGWRTFFLIAPILGVIYSLRGLEEDPALAITVIYSVAWAIYIYRFLLDADVVAEFQRTSNQDTRSRQDAAGGKDRGISTPPEEPGAAESGDDA